MEMNTKKKDKLIIGILLMPVLLLLFLWNTVKTPIDYIKYKLSRYYKDTHEKYTWLCGFSDRIKLYDVIKKEDLPVEYHRCGQHHPAGYGYFIYKDILILTDFAPVCFDAEQNRWTVEIEDEYKDMGDEAEKAVTECNAFLQADVCKKAAVLIDGDVYIEHPDTGDGRFSFAPVYGRDIAGAIKTLLGKV